MECLAPSLLLEPSLELDALVAEKIMGWQVDVAIPHKYRLPLYVNGFVTDCSQPFIWRPFRPSSDIAAAWQVVEKLLANGAQVSFDNVDEGDPERQWDVTVYQTNVADVSFPLALCRAALLDARP